MSSTSMIQQLLQAEQNHIDHVILHAHDIRSYVDHIEHAKIPALIINNTLPLQHTPNKKDIEALHSKGIEFYHSGRTGMPALVTAEDGLAVPGKILASNDKNLLELSVLGSYVVYLENNDMFALLNSGNMELEIPKAYNIVLNGTLGEWVSGTDIALYLVKYYDLPKNKNTLLEIQGEGLNALPLNERFNLARVLIDLGYEQLLFQVDDKVMAFLQDRSEAEGFYYFPQENAPKETTITIEIQKIHPMIAWIENDIINIAPLTDKDAHEIDQVFIGGSTACRYADIESGMKLIRYRPIADLLSACIIPGSQLVFGDMLDMGIAGILTEIGFDILPSSFLSLLVDQGKSEIKRIGTSVEILHTGGILANSLSCFSAGMTGKITHPLELESILKQEEQHQHDHEHSE